MQRLAHMRNYFTKSKTYHRLKGLSEQKSYGCISFQINRGKTLVFIKKTMLLLITDKEEGFWTRSYFYSHSSKLNCILVEIPFFAQTCFTSDISHGFKGAWKRVQTDLCRLSLQWWSVVLERNVVFAVRALIHNIKCGLNTCTSQ